MGGRVFARLAKERGEWPKWWNIEPIRTRENESLGESGGHTPDDWRTKGGISSGWVFSGGLEEPRLCG